MKIINVTPGLLPIPPNGWGAVEKIIWEMHQNFLKCGHDSQIKYLNEVPADAGVVHIHVANLANEAHSKGMPYYFTMHDHHAYLYGKDSDLYKENLKAIQNAKKAFVPAKYLVEYFNGIPEYFSHGVNTDYFTPIIKSNTRHSLLCVANNGYIYDQSEDRKGFGPAIEAAKSLGLPITIAGPKNNKNYFDKNPPNYDKLTVLYNLTEQELLEMYQTHTIFLHLSDLEAGHPNLTLLEAMSCGLPIVGTYESESHLMGMEIVDRHNLDDITNSIENIINSYQVFSNEARNQAELLSWKNQAKLMIKKYGDKKIKNDMREKLIHHYNNTVKLNKESKKYVPTYNMHNIDGMFTEILGSVDKKYHTKFINKKTNQEVYSVDMSNNTWAKTSIKYYVPWQVQITDVSTGEKTVHDLVLDDKTVYIALDSKSIGDTIAWFPYVDEFRKKHKCNVVCSTFWNHWFESEYPEIKFVKPGSTVNGIIAMYTIGIFYKEDGTLDDTKHPENPIKQPLQKVASDILGLEYTELRPKMKKYQKAIVTNPSMTNLSGEPWADPYVAIGFHSTAQAKYWNNPSGWQEVVDYTREAGYKAVILSNEGDGYMGNTYPKGVLVPETKSLDEVIQYINGCEFFIGISSGLTWLAWALGKKVVLISGFTDENLEFTDCIRVINKSVCNGCWARHKFDPGNWNWCPEHEKTNRQFECTKEITAKQVITAIKSLFI